MKILFGLFVVLLLVALFLCSFRFRGGVCVYKKRKYLLTNAERSFYGVLLEVLKGLDVELFCKVRLLDIVYPEDNNYRCLNKVKSKHIDFLVCDKNSVSPILAIELDDSSHALRKERDEFVDGAMMSAAVPLVRFKVRASYNLDAVRDEVMRSLFL